MSWMQFGAWPYTLGETELWPVDPVDIANSLAKLNRFTGHTIVPYSVARHSIYVSKLLGTQTAAALYGLVHDVHETVIGDISTPVKNFISVHENAILNSLEDAVDKALYPLLGVPLPWPPGMRQIVKQADLQAMAAEKRDLMPPCKKPWGILLGVEVPVTPVTIGTTWEQDANDWLARLAELRRLL